MFGYRKGLDKTGVGSIKIFRRNFLLQRRMSRFSNFCRKVFVQQCRETSYGNPFLFHYFRLPKKFGSEAGGGKSMIFHRKIWSHSAEKNLRGTLWCFINFGYRKRLDKRRGGLSSFSVKIYLFHSAEKFRRVTL